MSSIDERIVEMRFNNKQFESGVKTSLKTLDDLKKGLNLDGAAKSLTNLEKTANSFSLDGLAKGVDTIASRFSTMGIVATRVLQNITDSAYRAGTQIVKSLTLEPIIGGFSEYETKINAITTILTNTQSKGTTLDQVNAALDELNKYADLTIYNFGEMTRNIGTFTAAGVDLETAVDAIKGIANLGAGSGSSPTQVATAMYQLSQALAAGRVTLQDWNSVVNAGMGGEMFQNALKETAKQMGIIFDESSSFRESISTAYGKESWLTSDVLLKTLQKFANDPTLTKAATQVRTVTQLFSTMAESMQSGWAQSWEYIIGNRDEAAKLLTGISEGFNSIIQPSTDARNAMLKFWHDNGGRDALIEGLSNAFQGLLSILRPIKNAFRDIFPAMTGERLVEITKSFRDLTANFKISETTANNLQRTFRGLFAVLDIIGQAILAVAKGFVNLIGYFAPVGDGILGITGSLGDFLVSVDEAIKSTDFFGKAIEGIGNFIKPVADLLGAFVLTVVDFIKSIGNIDTGGLDTFAEKVQKRFEPFTKIGEVFEKIGGVIQGIFKKLSPIFSKLASIFGNAFNALADGITTAFNNADYQTVFDIINNGLIGTILFGIQRFMSSITSVVKSGKSVVDSFKGILDGVRGCLQAWQQSLKADTLLKIAGAMAILTAAVISLSFVDSKKLASALAAMGGMFTELFGSMAVFEKLMSAASFKNMGKISVSMIALSTAVLILAGAMQKLAKLDWTGIAKGLVGVAGLTAILVAAMKGLSQNSKGISKSAIGLVIFAAAINTLSDAVKKLGMLNTESLIKGLVGVGILVTEIALFMKATDLNKIGVLKATGIVLVAASLKILASAVDDLGQINLASLTKGLVAIGVLLAEIGVFVNKTANASRVTRNAIGITILASSMLIFADAIEQMESLPLSQIGKGLLTIAGVLVAVTIAMNKLPSGGIFKSTSIVILASSMLIFADAIEQMGSLRLEVIGKGLLTMAGALTAVTIAMNLLPNGMVGKATGLIEVAVALGLIYDAVRQMGGMSWEEIAKGLVTLAGSLTIIAVATRGMQTTLSGSAAVFVLAAALGTFTPVLKTLGSMPLLEIAKGLLALVGVFTVLGVAGKLLGGLTPTLLALSGVMALLGVAMLSMGAGLLAFSTALASLAVSGTAGAASLVAILSSIISLIPMIIKQIGVGIVEFAGVIADGGSAIAEAAKVLILALVDALVTAIPAVVDGLFQLLDSVLTTLVEYTPKITNALFSILIGFIEVVAQRMPELIRAGADLLSAFLHGVFEAFGGFSADNIGKIVGSMSALVGVFAVFTLIASMAKKALKGAAALLGIVGILTAMFMLLNLLPVDNTLKIATALSEALLAISACMAIISKVPVAGAMQGITGLGVVVAGLTAVLTALGALAQIPGLTWLVEEGSKVLSQIGNAIGSFVGNIIGGFMGGISSSFPKIGTDLSSFITNAQPFLDGVQKIDASSLEGVEKLVSIIMTLTGAGILDGLTSWLTGGSSIVKFGKQLAEFGPYLSEYANSVKGLDETAIQTSVTAASALSELAEALPNSGGLVGLFAGENDIDTFGEKLPAFGEGLAAYSDAVKNVDPEKITSSANAAKTLNELAQSIPNEGGLISLFTGDNDIGEFGDKIANFGKGLGAYSDAVKNVDAQKVITSVNAAKSLNELAQSLPNDGGLIGLFAGNNSIGAFGVKIAVFGEGLAKYAESVSGISDQDVTASANAAKALASLAQDIPKTGGLISLFAGNNDIGDFGKKLPEFGEGLAAYADSVKDFKGQNVTASANAAKALAELAKDIPKTGGLISFFAGNNDLGEFGSKIAIFGKGLGEYAASLGEKGFDADKVVASANAAKALTELAESVPRMGGLIEFFTGSNDLALFGSKLPVFGDGLAKYAESVAGFDDTGIKMSVEAAKALNELAQNIPNEGGLVSLFTGENDIALFGTKLPIFGEGLAKYAAAVADFNNSGVQLSIEAAKALNELAQSIPNEGGLLGLFAGDNDIAMFGQKLPIFGDGLAKYATTVAEFNNSGVSPSIEAAKALNELAQNIPSEGGLFSLFTGNSDIALFGARLPLFADGLVKYAEAVSGFDNTGVPASVEAAKTLAELSSVIPETGGFFSLFTGDNDLVAFSAKLPIFGQALADYSSSISGFSEKNVDAAANAGKTLAELAAAIPESGGFFSLFTGDNDIALFGTKLPIFGSALAQYATNVGEIDEKKMSGVNAATNIGKSLSELAASIPESGGFFSLFTGDNNIAQFGQLLPAFGDGLAKYSESVKDIDAVQATGVIDEVKALVSLMGSMSEVDYNGVAGFSYALTTLGNTSIDEFINTFTNANERVTEAAETMLTTFINGAKGKTEDLKTAIKEIIDTALRCLKDKQKEFKSVGKETLNKFADGVSSKEIHVSNTYLNVLSGAITKIRNKYQDFYNAAAYLVDGFAAGITDNTYKAEAEAQAMASAASTAARKELDERSPSKVGYQIGDFFGIAFVNAIGSHVKKAYRAGSSIAESAKNGLGNASSKIRNFVAMDMDVQPKITPVLDLSNVMEGTSHLNALFSRTQALAVNADMNHKYDFDNQNDLESKNPGSNVFNFTQNNYSPKALSRADIYRQTKNQFSALERKVKV